MEIRVSAWRLSQFLHGEQGALLVASQLVNPLPELDCKLYASTQVVDEGRHVEVFERYVKKLHKIYPVDPLLKAAHRRDPHHGALGAEAPRHADAHRGAGHRRLQRHAQANGRSHPRPAPGLRAAGRGPPRELRLLRAEARPCPTWTAPSTSCWRTSPCKRLRLDVRPRRADGLSVHPGRLEGDGLGRRCHLAGHHDQLADRQGLQPLPLHRGADARASSASPHELPRRDPLPGASPRQPVHFRRSAALVSPRLPSPSSDTGTRRGGVRRRRGSPAPARPRSGSAPPAGPGSSRGSDQARRERHRGAGASARRSPTRAAPSPSRSVTRRGSMSRSAAATKSARSSQVARRKR